MIIYEKYIIKIISNLILYNINILFFAFNYLIKYRIQYMSKIKKLLFILFKLKNIFKNCYH